jgi:hypothetical protein
LYQPFVSSVIAVPASTAANAAPALLIVITGTTPVQSVPSALFVKWNIHVPARQSPRFA